MFPGLLGILLGFVILLKICSKEKSLSGKRSPFEIKISPEMVIGSHEDDGTKQNMNATLYRNLRFNSEEKRIRINKNYMRLELEMHNGLLPETVACMKNNLHSIIYKAVHEDNFPGFVQKNLPIIGRIKNKIEEEKYTWLCWIFRKVKMISRVYVDLFKDIALTASILYINGGITSLIYFPTKMTSVVIFSLTASIIIPLLLSGLSFGVGLIQESQEDLKFQQKVWPIVKSLLLCGIQPLLINNELENLNVEIINVTQNDRKVLQMLDQISYLEKAEANFLKTDLQLETINQMTIQFLLIFMALTSSPTTGGLEAMFRATNPYLLSLSIFWSLKTAGTEIIKFISLEKKHFPFFSKSIALLYGLFSASTKVLVNVVFFVPSLGLFNILNHWQAEQIPFAVRSSSFQMSFREFNGGMVHLFNATPFPWNSIDRWTIDNKPPKYTLYTGLSLANYFTLFLVINAFHTALLFIVKIYTSPRFKKAGLIKQTIHSLENTTIPVPFEDWDAKSGTIEEHKKRRLEVRTEVLATLGINKIIVFSMLVPLMFTGMYLFSFLKCK